MNIRLPVMQCDEGCGECCGIVPASAHEFDRVLRYAKKNGVIAVRQGSRCPFYQGGKCAVHEVRPFICRMFGHVADLQCPRGYNVNLDSRKADRMFEQHLASCRTSPTRTLHEACYSRLEIAQLIAAEVQQPPAETGGSASGPPSPPPPPQ